MSCTQIFMTRYLFLQIVYEDYIQFDAEQAENSKCAERQKTSIPKELVESTDSYKPLSNKI